MSPDEQPTILTSPPNGSRPAPMGWQAPSVEEMQAMLPQYEIMEILGRGGMGAVYKGRQKSLKRLVAIKILPLDAADDEMKFVERFQNEAQTMAAMNHPAIVAVHDFGETKDGLLYFIMEYVDGTDVQKMIQASGKLSGEYALAITAHVCDALDYAHKRGVIHRDIKPANILIDQEGHIKVADFGLAKMDDPSQTSGLTKTNMAMGTPDYVAPEVLSPGMVADHRADLYAVGVMLYQMLTGEVPRGLFKLPSRKGIGSDPRFDEIICKAMEQDREERYQSAGDLRRALDVILTTPQPKDDGTGVVSVNEIPQKPVTGGPRPPGEKSADSPAQRPHQRAAAPQKSADKGVRAPAKKPSRASTWLGIGGIMAVVSVAAFMVFSSKPKPEPVGASASAASGITPNPGTISPPQAANAPPQISNWQDVTGVLREKLATKQGYVVDASGVHRAPGTPNGDTMVMAPSEKDRAVRVRYIGQSQVTLGYKGGSGGAYVLATKTSTMFKRQAQKDGEAVSIIPSVVHPAGFDPALSHELIVVVKGSAVRAWLDGVYLGDAEDAALGDCPIAIMPMSSSTVQKVEIAELDRALIASIPTLKKINSKPVSERQGGSTAPPSASTVDDAFLAQVAAAPAARQVELVKEKIEALNGAKVKVEPTIKEEKVTGLRIIRADASVPDVSPIAALKDLDSLQLEYLTVRDITCLRGLKLVNLTIWDGRFDDVSVLQSLPLQTLSLKQTHVSDYSVLKGKALQKLDLEWCVNLSDISFIKGMPLKYLRVPKTKVRDLSPIAGLPLVELVCDPEAKLDPALVRSIPALKKINSKPVSEWLSGSTGAPPSASQGKVIDLLALVDVKRDTIAGEWVRTADGLAKQGPGTTDNGAPRLQLPYQPPEEYDFEVEFTAVAEQQSVGQILSAQSRVFSWIVAGNKPEAPMAGFELFDNGPTSRPSEAAAPMKGNFEKGRRHVSRVEVRKAGLRGFLNGVELVNWSGDFKRLSPGTTGTLRDDKHLGLRAARDVIFHKITVREITGTGKVDAGAVSAHSSPVGRSIDLLPLVDLKRDVIAGEWVRTADGLAKQGPGTTDKGAPRLQLPYQPPEEYDFEVEFTSVTENQYVGQMVAAQSRVFGWMLAANTAEAPIAGFEMFDGAPASKLSEVSARMKTNLEKGRRYVSLVEVRSTGVRGLLDGVELVNWEGNFKRLSPGTTAALRDDKHLGLRAARGVIYHKITVREITGTGKVDAGVATTTSSPSLK